MPKATLKLRSGATVIIEGSAAEVHEILKLHAEATGSTEPSQPPFRRRKEAKETPLSMDRAQEIVNLIRSCAEAERIEGQILDKSNTVNRCLLPLYIIHEHFDDAFGLTTGNIDSITKSLGVRNVQSNVSHTLAGAAAKFVMADSVRKKGVPVEYKINRRGVQHLKVVINNA